MWKDYSKSFIKNNPASTYSVMAAAFIATMFLSLLCTIAYNVWSYDIEKIKREEGDWQARIVNEALTSENLDQIYQFENVEKVDFHKDPDGSGLKSADIYFKDPHTIYKDMPLIAKELGIDVKNIEYHDLLLSRYFIHDPKDTSPPMLLGLFLVILLIMCLSLVLIIRGTFDLSMSSRIHQLGILSSIGATPRQIRTCLIQEALALCILPILAGTLTGILLAYGFVEALNYFARDITARQAADFKYTFWLFILSVLLSLVTVLISAAIPAVKLSKIPPLQAIRDHHDLSLKKKRKSFILPLLFGIQGELAGNALKAQKKSLRISSLSLMLSFLGFSIMLCFVTLTTISTQFTYFERYQDTWDVMSELKDTQLNDFNLKKELISLDLVRDAAAYQKADAAVSIFKDQLDEKVLDNGGLEAIAGIEETNGKYEVEAPVIVMDDESFLKYCKEAGIKPSLEGSIVLNRLWNSTKSNFRNRKYIPFLKDNIDEIQLKQDHASAVVPVSSFTDKVPLLREEYEDYALVQFIPLSLWNEKFSEAFKTDPETLIRLIAAKPVDLNQMNSLEKEVNQILSTKYEVKSENRLQEKEDNDSIMNGMVMVYSAFCILLAVIGIANIFSHTLGFLRQRKREFAQYMSVGMTPKQMKKMFYIEGMFIAGKPLLITLPLTFIFIQFAVSASYIDPMLFWNQAPIGPILLFAAVIVFFVALAYYIGAKRLLNSDLSGTLRNDTLS